MTAAADRMTDALQPTPHRAGCACAACAHVTEDRLRTLARAYEAAPTRAEKIRAGLNLLEFLDGKESR